MAEKIENKEQKEKEDRIAPKKEAQPMRDTNLENIITNAMDFWKKIYEAKKVQIKFTKKSGEVRYMLATLNFDYIPQEKRPIKLDLVKILKLVKENGIIRVFDLEKKDWRSVPFLEVEWLKTSDNKTYRVIKNKRNYENQD